MTGIFEIITEVLQTSIKAENSFHELHPWI